MFNHKAKIIGISFIILSLILTTQYAFTQGHPQWPGLEEAKKSKNIKIGWYEVPNTKTLPPDWTRFVFATKELNAVKGAIFNVSTINNSYGHGNTLKYEVYGPSFGYKWPSGRTETCKENIIVDIAHLRGETSSKISNEYHEAVKSALYNVDQSGWQEYWNMRFEKVSIDKDCEGYVAITAPASVKFKPASYKSDTIPNTYEFYVLLYKDYLINIHGVGYHNTRDTKTAIYRWVLAFRDHLIKTSAPESALSLQVFMHDDYDKPVPGKKVSVRYWVGKTPVTKTAEASDAEGNIVYTLSDDKDFKNDKGHRLTVLYNDQPNMTFNREGIILPAKIDILVTTLEKHVDYLKDSVGKFLKAGGFSDDEVSAFLNKFNVNTADNSPWYDSASKTVNVPGEGVKTLKNLKDFDLNFTHEVGHYVCDSLVDPTYVAGGVLIVHGKVVGGEHNTWQTPKDGSQETAFDETISEFFGQQYYKHKSKGAESYNPLFESPDKAKETADSLGKSGNYIEGNMASFLNGYYKEGMEKPADVFKDFADTIKNYEKFSMGVYRPARTIEEFLEVKLDTDTAGKKYSGNLQDLTEEYRIKSSKTWQTVASSRDLANMKIKVIMPGRNTEAAIPEKVITVEPSVAGLKITQGAVIEMAQDTAIGIKRYPDDFFKTGKPQWIYNGPNNCTITISTTNDIPQLNKGSAQFENTPAMAPDGQTIITPTKTNFAMEVDENKNVRVTTISGEVAIENRKTQEKGIVSENRFITIKPGVPLETSQPVSDSDMRTWWVKPSKAITVESPACSAPPPDETIALKNSQYRIWLPPGWKVSEGREDVEFALEPKDAVYIVQLEKIPVKDGIDVAIFAKAWEDGALGPEKKYREKSGGESVTICGENGYQADYLASYDGMDLYCIITVFVSKGNAYVLTCLRHGRSAEDLRDIADKMVSSLALLTAVNGSESPVPYLGKIFSDEKMAFAMRYPEDWAYETPSEHVVIFSGKKGTGAYYSTVSIQNFLSTQKGGKFSDVGSLVRMLTAQFNAGATDVKIYDKKVFVYTMSDGRKLTGVSFMAEYIQQSERFKKWDIVLPRVSGDVFHVWSYTSSPNQYDTYLPVAVAMLDSWDINDK